MGCALPMPYLGSRECPALLYKLQNPAHVLLCGAKDLAKGNHAPVIVDSCCHVLPCELVTVVCNVLGGA